MNVFEFKIFMYFTEKDCETPNGKKGRCTFVLECGSLLPLVKDDLSASERNFLTKSVCGQGSRQVR